MRGRVLARNTLHVVAWFMLIVGVFTQGEWLFMPAAFFILNDKLDAR